VRWIKDLGIMGGAGDTGPVAAYGQLSDGECAFMLPLDTEQFTARELRLYRGAAHACLAAFHGEPGRWAQAAADFAALSGQTGGFNCLDRNAYSLLKSLVETHRQAPTARLVRGGGADGAAPACPRILDVVPNHGPAAGGYPVRLVGEHLPARAVVEWSGRSFEVSTKDGREATLTVPPLGDAQIASIWVDGWPYGLYGAVEFTYDPEPTPAAT
jgi:hypothetical protein